MISRGFSEPTDRVKRLKKAIVDAIPYVESERAVLVTESYKETEGLSPIMRRAKAAEKILHRKAPSLPAVLLFPDQAMFPENHTCN